MDLTKTKSHFIRLACHPYPTRSKLGRSVSRQSSFSHEESRADDEAKDEALVPCKRRKKEKNILYLPREIIFNILVRVPAQVLHDTVRYVCKLWFEIVRDADFVTVHRQISPTGFPTQPAWSHLPYYYIDVDTASLKVTKVGVSAPTRVLCCYNDLVLLSDSTNEEILHVVNVVTKVETSLPPLVGFRSNYGSIGLAVDSSGHYKVVYVTSSQHVYMRVFTIGVDEAWRFIDLQGIHISAIAQSSMLYSRPDCFGGFIYWLKMPKCYLGLALDVNTETIYQFSKPNYLVQGDHSTCVIGIGTGVGLIYTREPLTWKIWKLTEVKSGQWTELACIDVRELHRQFGYKLDYSLHLRINPVRLFRGDLWFYGHFNEKFIVVRYNLSNKSFETISFKTSQLPSKPPSSSKHMIFTQELLASPDL
ncbi:uncharacterized protein LOC141615400 [Silene latifolia]|uniref:uncharacterized protein LOC141615400 n=1 Tax=Silene latifolia TaxID=37657 RepID=UPI003D76E12A